MRRLNAGESVPDFAVTSILGKDLSPASLAGAPSLLVFHRYARCAICNDRIREFRRIIPELTATTGLRVVFVCHSDRDRLRGEFGEASLPFDVVPDPERRLYDMFGVARSLARTLRPSSIRTAVRARRAMPNDGRGPGFERPLTMIPAEFFVDSTGTIVSTHYGEYLGDTWSSETIARLAREHQHESAS